MGLELVEYVLAIEDAFEIAIPDADAARLDTPRKLVDYLCARLGEASEGPPLVQTAFYRVRAALADELGVPRSRIGPRTALADLTDRPANDVWKAVAARLSIPAKFLTHAPNAQWLGKLLRMPPRPIGEVAERLATFHPAAIKPAMTGWTRAQVTEVVLKLLEYEIAIDVKLSDLDRTFIRDLGMG